MKYGLLKEGPASDAGYICGLGEVDVCSVS